MWKRTTTYLQFTLVCWLAAIAEGKFDSSAITRESPKLQLLPRPLLDESKVYHSNRWRFHVRPKSPKLFLPPNGHLITKRSRSLREAEDISSPIRESMTSEDADTFVKNNDEFHLTSEMVGGGGLQLFGVTNSFVNPGALLSSTIENGLKQLSEAANSLSNKTSVVVQPSPATTNGSLAQFFGIASGNLEEQRNIITNPIKKEYPSITNGTLAQFFGIANIYVGDEPKKSTISQPSDCSECPFINYIGCLAPPEEKQHAILTVTVTACETLSSLGACSAASSAPSGTLFVSYPFGSSSSRRSFIQYLQRKKKKKKPSSLATTGSAVVGIVATPPNTKVSVTCPNIPSGITVTTQNGPVLPYRPREETGFIQLLVSGTASPANVAVACVWTSSP
ncbi:uncharacterized protein LOC124312398 isoform X2 [Daphnia pulicaria]|uniref:uncharacterized protein LOC124312398 isoform X2 n=1 Tax=Daphnia pulicaria TaxID=35523 RepID=UPI001EEC2CB5|nr:uncharacterized protein LOC124312398 isoform X2 [Daphnia pulicaria]